jgi:hypothetical protein
MRLMGGTAQPVVLWVGLVRGFLLVFCSCQFVLVFVGFNSFVY